MSHPLWFNSVNVSLNTYIVYLPSLQLFIEVDDAGWLNPENVNTENTFLEFNKELPLELCRINSYAYSTKKCLNLSCFDSDLAHSTVMSTAAVQRLEAVIKAQQIN